MLNIPFVDHILLSEHEIVKTGSLFNFLSWSIIQDHFNPFHVTGLFLYPLKTSEN